MPGTSTLIASSMTAPYNRFISAGEVSSCIQVPDKSGLPSAVRGDGAVRSGLPSRVVGVPVGAKCSHCASAVTETATKSRNSHRCRNVPSKQESYNVARGQGGKILRRVALSPGTRVGPYELAALIGATEV